MRNRTGKNKRRARSVKRFVHNIKCGSLKITALVIVLTALFAGSVPVIVSYADADTLSDAGSFDLVSLQIAPVSVAVNIEESLSPLLAEKEAARDASKEEAARIAAEEEAERVAAEKEAARIAAEEEAERIAAEEEAERIAAEEEAARIAAEEEAERIAAEEEAAKSASTYEAVYSFSQFISHGAVNWNGWRWTFYSEIVLPGGGLNIPGRHVDEQGFICDENNRICLAAHPDDLPKGSVVATPFGKDGCVYDVCGVKGTLDVYVHW